MTKHPTMIVPVVRCLALLFSLLVLASPPAAALDSHFNIGDYRHDAWGAREGAPPMVLAMAQTRDGWLWLGTYRGLYRFDGVSFERFEPMPGEALLYNAISTMAAAPNGDLLIGYLTGGLSILRNGHLLHLTSVQKQSFSNTFAVLADIDGTYWVGAINGLMHLRGGTWEKIGAAWDFPGSGSDNLALDRYGRLFASDGSQLFMLDRKTRKFHRTGVEGNAPDLSYGPDGQLWLHSGTRVSKVELPHAGLAITSPPDSSATTVMGTLFDRDGNLWLYPCAGQICMIKHAALPSAASFDVEKLPAERLVRDKQHNEHISAMLEDREGNIWIGTATGIERLRNNRLAKIAYPAPTMRASIAHDPDGKILLTLGFPSELFTVDGDSVRPASAHTDTRMLREGPGNTLLLATPDALIVRERDKKNQDKERSLAFPKPRARGLPTRLIEDSADSFWIGWDGRPSLRYAAGQWHTPDESGLLPERGGGTSNGDGHLWIGYANNTVIDSSATGARRYTAADGVDVRAVAFIDVQREVLAAGDGGLQVLAGGRFRHVRADNPEVLSGINGLLIAPNGDRWFNSAKGVLHIAARDWQAVMRDPAALLRYDLLDQLDGYPGSAQIGNIATATAGPDGRMWFVASDGIALYDPRHDHRATTPPAPVIRSVTADGQRFSPFQNITLPPGTDRIAIEFTALSYTIPERTVFRYRLDGIDKAWQGPLSRRDIAYANLGPGHYTFTLQAQIGDGAWSAQPASVSFTIRPRFTQTAWFMLLCALAVVALGLLAHRLRLRHVTQGLHAPLRERQRIARTLHDTFLQSLQALVWRFDVIKKGLPADEEATQLIDKTLIQAEEVMAEGRRQILDLRPVGERGQTLETRLAALVESLRQRSAVPIDIAVKATPSPQLASADLLALVASEAFHIASEAMSNALQHGQLTVLDVELLYARDAFVLTIRNDGGGIDAAILATGGRQGHWGLTGMRERAHAIGGSLTIASPDGKSTVVTLRVPRRRAYVLVRGTWLLVFWEKWRAQ